MNAFRPNRRTIIRGIAGTAALAAGFHRRQAPTRAVAQSEPTSPLIAPIGWDGEAPGDGFVIRHGFACENTWYNPGWWHTGEDWYAVEGDTGDAAVYAVVAGQVVYAAFDYPGRVVILRHADDLFSVYGHLDFDLSVREGQAVAAGDVLGRVLLQVDGRAPSHLHFEMRTFLTTSRVNGDAPSYGVRCGMNCPPGPGYWPIDAAEHPAAMGWRNPTHQQAALALDAGILDGLVARVQEAAGERMVRVHAEPNAGADAMGELALAADDTFPLLDVAVGDPAATGTSAEAYDLWLRIETGGVSGWVRAAIPSDRDTGSDGRPSSLDRPFLVVSVEQASARER